MKIDLDQIQELLEVVCKADIVEFSIEVGEEKVTIKKSHPSLPIYSAEVSSQSAMIKSAPLQSEISFDPKPEAQESPLDLASGSDGLVPVSSPMVGTFYRAASPTAQAYVNIGDRIAVGQTVCVIEAMKLMNDMPSEVAGKIVKICVENGSTVEYGQPLFLVDPKG